MNPIEKLKKIRKEQKLSQKEFSKKYGLKENSLKYVESGNQKFPDKLAYALEKEYGIPYKWWTTGEGKMSVEQSTQEEGNEEIREIAECMQKNPQMIKEIMTAVLRETDLMHYAALAIAGDQKARERFIKLTMPE